ncbi:uncharacterized protein LOC113461430 [Phoenix dactylifera]|uniref:Uncharacterized protein LOC113461430 n=1 Tax=Phoenix dactylifera TaxID=42345 RepID=A0A8B8ZK36_PHODC|nr:uncharacterized protein LOC113461430 [Phoenix dactylifera]
MEKEGGLGVRRKPTKRRSRGFAKAVKDYLVSDSYMYAPLIDSPPLDSPPSPDVRSPPTAGQRAYGALCETSVRYKRASGAYGAVAEAAGEVIFCFACWET